MYSCHLVKRRLRVPWNQPMLYSVQSALVLICIIILVMNNSTLKYCMLGKATTTSIVLLEFSIMTIWASNHFNRLWRLSHEMWGTLEIWKSSDLGTVIFVKYGNQNSLSDWMAWVMCGLTVSSCENCVIDPIELWWLHTHFMWIWELMMPGWLVLSTSLPKPVVMRRLLRGGFTCVDDLT